MRKSTIAIGIVECNRDKMLRNLLSSIKNVRPDYLSVISDGQKISNATWVELQHAAGDPFDYCWYDCNQNNKGVGFCKNYLLEQLYERDPDYIFILEDDIIIKDTNVFDQYIKASQATGIQHFNFALHGDDNKTRDGKPAPRLTVEYSDDVKIDLYPNVYGAFSFFTRECIQQCGFMDENYFNAMEHVDHTMRIITNKMHPPFRWFADIHNSDKYIGEQDQHHNESVIRKSDQWMENFRHGVDRFKNKFNIDVTNPHETVASKEDTIKLLKEIKQLWKK